MKITPQLKAWLVQHCGIDPNASDDEFRKAAGVAFSDGTLTAEKYTELSTDREEQEADEFSKRMDEMASSLNKLASILVTKEEKTATPKESANLGEKIAEQIKEQPEVRVKGAEEMYSTSKSALTFPDKTRMGTKHPFAGKPVNSFSEGGRPMDSPSDLDKAVAGAWAKFLISKSRNGGSKTQAWNSLPEHDKQLLQYALENEKWCGSHKDDDEADIIDRKLGPTEQKALIDDVVSGGLEAAPIVFDDMVISAPLLTGELYPLVNVVPIDRGRRVEGVITGNVTGAWGGIDATNIAYFNTAAYVTAFDTTIHRWQVAVQVGLDFLSDTPIDFGAHITAQFGERLAEDLDDAIAAGNGTTAPEGVINRAGIGTVNWGGATSIGNYESLRFGITKQEFTPAVASTAVFCGTLTSYQRARALAVGAADARRLFGMDYGSYAIMEHPYKISGALANTQIFFAIMGRYRMYRRRGLTLRQSVEGDTNIRGNLLLLTATARFGGRLERGACGVWTNATAPA